MTVKTNGAEAMLEASIVNKKLDHSTVQTCTSTAPSGVPAIAALKDVLAAMEKFKPKDEWVLLTPEGQCVKGAYGQIMVYMTSRHPLLKDVAFHFDRTEKG